MKIKAIILTIVILITCLINTTAQNGITAKLLPSPVAETNTVAPQFPGGDNELYKFLASNIRYPYILIKIQMEGDLDVRFTIDKVGKAKNIEITRGFDPMADEEVIRVLQMMPAWTPATQNGQPVDTEQKLSVNFNIDEELLKRAEEMRAEQKNDDFFVGSSSNKPEDNKISNQLASSDNITQQTDTLLNKTPQYPGGKEAMEAYLKANLKYPKRAIQMGIEGRVLYNVLISADGEILRIALFKGIYRDCNEEAFYLIKKMPKWIPGMRDGKPTAMEVMIPVPFVLPR
ncbi:energy transducer TonB [Prevotella sp. 10(H)]|uniref:energy transducer TonB n=1 Tax=Prevotella sp. 10(H) TaxID=1158294 RepID=UPI000691E6FF|nr:energy transducer TonB [Prevotella sp. 10(H)]